MFKRLLYKFTFYNTQLLKCCDKGVENLDVMLIPGNHFTSRTI